VRVGRERSKSAKREAVEQLIKVEEIGATRIKFNGQVFKWKGDNADGSRRFNIKEGKCDFRILQRGK
jgi:hypothetical protein